MSTQAIKVLEPTKTKMEVKPEPGGPGGIAGGGGGNQRDKQQQQNNQKRKRGGGPPFQFSGRGGGGGGRGGGGPGSGNFNRNQGNFHSNNDFDVPLNKRPKVQGPDGRVYDKLMSIQGPTADLPPKQFEAKKFNANTRLYIGNISSDVTEVDIRELFGGYGEIDEVFINREKNFAFLKLDFRTSAERARAELDQKQIKGRPLKVRFAPANVRVKVRNLGPMVSNELLELAFGVFGEIEKALVFVDEKGKSLGEGIVDFTRKNNAQLAHKYCSDKCFFLTAELRPVITELCEMYEVDEGLLEANLPRREFNKNQENSYYKSRDVAPRIAETGTFESDFGEKWKALVYEYKAKEVELKAEMQKELDKLQTQMELARYDHETELLRQQLRQREIDQERHKMEWDTRMQQRGVPRNYVGGSGGNSGFSGRMDESQSQNNMDMPPEENPNLGSNNGDMRGNNMPLAPPPMPPQGLMAHLHAGPDEDQGGPTWELGPFGFGQIGGNFGQPFHSNESREGPGPRFMGPRGPPRGGMSGSGPRGGFRGSFRGNRGGRR